MSTETTNHHDAVCSMHGLPCRELGEVLIERDALRSRLGMLMPADAIFDWEEWPGGWPEILSAYETQRGTAAALREKLDDCLETLRLIEKVTRPDGDMADAAVNLLVRSCRWKAFADHASEALGEVQP